MTSVDTTCPTHQHEKTRGSGPETGLGEYLPCVVRMSWRGEIWGLLPGILTSAIRRKHLFCSAHPGRLVIYSVWDRCGKQIAVRNVKCELMSDTYSVMDLVNYPVAWLSVTSPHFPSSGSSGPGEMFLARRFDALSVFLSLGLAFGLGLVTCCHVIG